MLYRIFSYLIIFNIVLLFNSNISHAQIIANHNAVAQFDQISDDTIAEIKKMHLNYLGESHSHGLLYGLQLLEDQYGSKYAVEISFDSQQLPVSTDHLRATRVRREENRPNWPWAAGAGEETFWTNTEARNMIKNHLTYMKEIENKPVDVMGFGWCWDMTGATASPDEDEDEHVHWYGVAYSYGIDQATGQYSWKANLQDWWGIDSNDNQDGQHPITLHDYLLSVDEYNAHMPTTTTFFSTGPVDGTKRLGEVGYQRYLKNEAIRDYVNLDSNRVLFDYADILSYGDDLTQNKTTWDSHEFPVVHSDNDIENWGDQSLWPDQYGTYDYHNYGDGIANHARSHIGKNGCIRLAKAMWWMLAQIVERNNPPTKVATPYFSPAAGQVETDTEVIIGCNTDDATIYYTTNGDEPTQSSYQYTDPITITQNITIKARAYKDHLEASNIREASYTIQIDPPLDPPEDPIITPNGGEVAIGDEVTITCATNGVDIRYTTDGSDPTEVSNLYNNPIIINQNVTIKARAFGEQSTQSNIVSATYTIAINPPQKVAAPIFSPGSGELQNGALVAITCSTDDATIYYTTDGSVPTISDQEYTTPISITQNLTIRARAFKAGFIDSNIAQAQYTIENEPTPDKPADPIFTPHEDQINAGDKVSITCSTNGALIRYTTDNTEPTIYSQLYIGPITILYTVTIRARAFNDDLTQSDTVSATYTVNNTSEPVDHDDPIDNNGPTITEDTTSNTQNNSPTTITNETQAPVTQQDPVSEQKNVTINTGCAALDVKNSSWLMSLILIVYIAYRRLYKKTIEQPPNV
ncbi:MAG: chitobiase/beta-hexosaminidase C-terminal domain-containing protein [Deltaproteobacteria bacterium]|nr:chitobiase/beta-hexosaminidase C-terminal domain-containing protein [Deltaproteobacteria bacterium]